VGPGECVITALKLGLPDEDAAVGVRCRAELQLEDKVLRELARRPQLLNATPFRRRGDDQSAMLRNIAAVVAGRLAVEVRLLFQSLFLASAPAGEVATIEQAHEAGLEGELVVPGFQEI